MLHVQFNGQKLPSCAHVLQLHALVHTCGNVREGGYDLAKIECNVAFILGVLSIERTVHKPVRFGISQNCREKSIIKMEFGAENGVKFILPRRKLRCVILPP